MKTRDAKEFLRMIVGFELCTNAGEDEAAQYPVSPIPRSFMIGYLGVESVQAYLPNPIGNLAQAEKMQAQGRFFVEVGEALVRLTDDPA